VPPRRRRWGQDGSAASKDEQEDEQAEEDLERVQLTATGVEPVENGAGHVAHSEAVWTVGHVERNLTRALSVRSARTDRAVCRSAGPSSPPPPP
jgi:hypothetical protein